MAGSWGASGELTVLCVDVGAGCTDAGTLSNLIISTDILKRQKIPSNPGSLPQRREGPVHEGG